MTVRTIALFGVTLAASVFFAAPTASEALSTEPASTDPAWSTVAGTLRKPIGSYHRETIVSEGANVMVLGEEFVDYDLSAKWLDRRITKAGQGVQGTRSRPALRFVYRPGYALMWNPSIAKQCHTPWVRFTAKTIQALTGADLTQVFSLEPAVALASRRSDPRVVYRDKAATVFRVLVNGAAGIPSSSATVAKADVVARLQRGTTTALVRVPHGVGPIRISVDITHAIDELGGGPPGGGQAKTVWTFERPPHRLDRSLPRKVSNIKSMG